MCVVLRDVRWNQKGSGSGCHWRCHLSACRREEVTWGDLAARGASREEPEGNAGHPRALRGLCPRGSRGLAAPRPIYRPAAPGALPGPPGVWGRRGGREPGGGRCRAGGGAGAVPLRPGRGGRCAVEGRAGPGQVVRGGGAMRAPGGSHARGAGAAARPGQGTAGQGRQGRCGPAATRTRGWAAGRAAARPGSARPAGGEGCGAAALPRAVRCQPRESPRCAFGYYRGIVRTEIAFTFFLAKSGVCPLEPAAPLPSACSEGSSPGVGSEGWQRGAGHCAARALPGAGPQRSLVSG